MKLFRSETCRLRRDTYVQRSYCLMCSWSATGSKEAVALAERAHKCRRLRPERGPHLPKPGKCGAPVIKSAADN
jgi:hypothetical protein